MVKSFCFRYHIVTTCVCARRMCKRIGADARHAESVIGQHGEIVRHVVRFTKPGTKLCMMLFPRFLCNTTVTCQCKYLLICIQPITLATGCRWIRLAQERRMMGIYYCLHRVGWKWAVNKSITNSLFGKFRTICVLSHGVRNSVCIVNFKVGF